MTVGNCSHQVLFIVLERNLGEVLETESIYYTNRVTKNNPECLFLPVAFVIGGKTIFLLPVFQLMSSTKSAAT